MVEASVAADLWTAMLKVYAMPGVAEACLELQDRFELDVSLFLAVLQATGRGSRIDADALRSLDESCGRWRAEVVRPLRAIRVQLKANPWLEADGPVASFRSALKALELDAEKLEIAALEEAIADLPRDEDQADGRARVSAVAQMVLEHFAGRALPEEMPQARLVVDAVWSLAGADAELPKTMS